MFKVHAYCKGVRIEEGETSPCVLLMAKPQAVDVVSFALIRRFDRFSNGVTEGCPMSVRITNLEACLEAVAQRLSGSAEPLDFDTLLLI